MFMKKNAAAKNADHSMIFLHNLFSSVFVRFSSGSDHVFFAWMLAVKKEEDAGRNGT